PSISTLFPYTTLFRSHFCVALFLTTGPNSSKEQFVLSHRKWRESRRPFHEPDPHGRTLRRQSLRLSHLVAAACRRAQRQSIAVEDRKSTRLNFSHDQI